MAGSSWRTQYAVLEDVGLKGHGKPSKGLNLSTGVPDFCFRKTALHIAEENAARWEGLEYPSRDN